MTNAAAELLVALIELRGKWDTLVDRVNVKGGEDFLDRGVLPENLLSQEDVRKLLQLVHPDKHDGKQMAVEMTQKLLKMKEAT